MTVRRGFLYTGVFLVAAGGVTLLAQAGLIDADRAAAVLAWWPLAVIAVGVGLLLRHTPAAIPGGLMAAAVPGMLFGGMIVAVPDLPAPCWNAEAATGPAVTREGTFGSAARVELDLSCGDLTLTTAPGANWRVDARAGHGRTTDVTSAADRLEARSDGRNVRFGLDPRALGWDVVLPTDPTIDLGLQLNAGRARVALGGAHLGRLSVDVNAGDAQLDLREATVARLALDVNAASAVVRLPSADLAGNLTVNAGSLDVCVPADLGLRVHSTTALGSTTLDGLVRRGDAWETPDYTTAPFHADLSVSASVGSVDISSEGGCK